MSTEFSDVYKLFFNKIQKDSDFFMYNNVPVEDALIIAKQRSKDYLIESVSKLILSCTPDIDFTYFNEDTEIFNETLTFIEKDLLANLMFEMYLEKDMTLLKALSVNLSPKDLNVFSPANERKTFMDMLKDIKKENIKMIKKYIARDRLTGKLKQINHSLYEV